MPAGHVEVVSTTPASNREGYVVRQVGEVTPVAAAETLANPTAFQRLSHGLLWNQTTWDREMGNIDGTAVSQATRTVSTFTGADIINYNHRGVHIVFNYSTGAALLNLNIEGKDELSDTYYRIANTVTLSATGSAAYRIYPGLSSGSATALVSAGSVNDVLPRTWRVVVQATVSVTANYGVGYSMIV